MQDQVTRAVQDAEIVLTLARAAKCYLMADIIHVRPLERETVKEQMLITYYEDSGWGWKPRGKPVQHPLVEKFIKDMTMAEALEKEKKDLEQRTHHLNTLTAALRDSGDGEQELDEVVQATQQLRMYLKTLEKPAKPQGELEPASITASTAAVEPNAVEPPITDVKKRPCLTLPGAPEPASVRTATAAVELNAEKTPAVSAEGQYTFTLPGRDTYIRNKGAPAQSVRRRSASQQRSADWILAV